LPSLDELGLPLDIDETTLDVGAPDDVLAAVKTEGRRRRARRHRRNTAIAMLGVALLAAPALALLPDSGDDDQVTVASDDASTTTERPSTTVPATTETSGPLGLTETTIGVATVETATTVPGTRPTPAPTTTVPPLVCHNSTNPACGQFRWDPPPGANQQMLASVSWTPAQPVVGEPVTFTVGWSDPDANAIDGFFSPDGAGLGAPCQYPQGYGPWTPPAPAPGSGSWTYTYTFSAPGSYTVAMNVWTGDVCANPYASEWHEQEAVTVTEAPAA